MIRNITANKYAVLFVGQKLNGGVLVCKSRRLFSPPVREKNDNAGKEEKCPSYDITQVTIPWPISRPIYGEGWRGYGRLISPTYDMATAWVANVRKRASTDATVYSKELLNFLSQHDVNTLYLLLISKGRQSSQHVIGELHRTKDQINILLKKTARLPENYLWNGKVKSVLFENVTLLLLKSREVVKRIKDDDIPGKLINLSYQTKNSTLTLIKNTKIPDEFLQKSNDLVSAAKINSFKCYERSKDLSKMIAVSTKTFADSSMKLLTQSYLRIPLKKSKYLESLQEILQGSKFKSSNPSYTYVNKFFDRSPKPMDNLTNVVQPNKAGYNSTPPKQEFHSSAVRMYKPIKISVNDVPYFWILLKPETISDLKLVGEISRLIPGPFKKIWRGIRDKRLPSLQGTIAAVLQKIQDSFIKKKK